MSAPSPMGGWPRARGRPRADPGSGVARPRSRRTATATRESRAYPPRRRLVAPRRRGAPSHHKNCVVCTKLFRRKDWRRGSDTRGPVEPKRSGLSVPHAVRPTPPGAKLCSEPVPTAGVPGAVTVSVPASTSRDRGVGSALERDRHAVFATSGVRRGGLGRPSDSPAPAPTPRWRRAVCVLTCVPRPAAAARSAGG